jgi:single-stranded DNA-binding protein
MKFLPSGDPLSTSRCVNRRYKDREGNQEEATDWFRVCAFNGVGRRAKHLQRATASRRGRLQVRQYDSSRTAGKSPSRSSPALCGSWVPVAWRPSVRPR